MAENKQPTATAEPKADRPVMPKGYGIPKHMKGTLKWSDVNGWLENAKIYWLATSHPDVGPHATPIWGAWVDGAFYFDGAPDTRWARNLAADPRIVVHIESGTSIVILKGQVEPATPDPDTFKRIADSYASRYPYSPESSDGMHVVRPHTAMAWDNDDFMKSATRWKLAKV